ncbi:MAG TPA: TAXI family TRAP transporter solute-binding subunit [Hyphomicrobiales bacterium]|nr:TAXI family TRAP transporter solute-binding subunit [Hyphomicrobiales bacterium]
MRISTALPIPSRFIWLLSLAFLLPLTAHAQSSASAEASAEAEQVARVNRWTVHIAGGTLAGSFIRFAAELATALDDGDDLRVLPVVTNGATDNVTDLLYLKGIDVAILHADVLEEYKVRRNVTNIDKRISYISQMYVSEVHLYVRPEINSIQDLEGKTVGLHVKGAGQTTTGPIVFERNGVTPKFVFVNNKIGIQKMKTGEFAAIVHNGGKPNSLIRNLKPEAGFKLLPIPYEDKFADYYVPSSFTHDDYPALIKEGETIETLGIPVVLGVYNWQPGTPRYRKVERFIEYYFKRFDRLRKPPFDPKWKGVNLGANVPGWTRFPPAQKMLDQMSVEARVGGSETKVDSTAAQELARALGIETADEQKLFTEFMKWRQQQDK